jgi:hypothetical protein
MKCNNITDTTSTWMKENSSLSESLV